MNWAREVWYVVAALFQRHRFAFGTMPRMIQILDNDCIVLL